MATFNASALLGSGIARVQRGVYVGTGAAIVISTIDPSKSELFVAGIRVPTFTYSNAGGTETGQMMNATLQLTANSITMVLGQQYQSGGNIYIAWEIREWAQ